MPAFGGLDELVTEVGVGVSYQDVVIEPEGAGIGNEAVEEFW
jgi:hypothetical protein